MCVTISSLDCWQKTTSHIHTATPWHLCCCVNVGFSFLEPPEMMDGEARLTLTRWSGGEKRYQRIGMGTWGETFLSGRGDCACEAIGAPRFLRLIHRWCVASVDYARRLKLQKSDRFPDEPAKSKYTKETAKAARVLCRTVRNITHLSSFFFLQVYCFPGKQVNKGYCSRSRNHWAGDQDRWWCARAQHQCRARGCAREGQTRRLPPSSV